MKVRIKNNRLALECHILNLEEAPEDRLREATAKFQIGWQRFISKDIEIINRGRTVTRTQETLEPKTRRQIEDELRSKLTVKFYIPREYWTERQSEAFASNDLLNEKDITREQEIKRSSGIMVVLPPYEETKDTLKKAAMFTDITEAQWEWLKGIFNRKYTRVKDDEGRTIKKKENYVHRLVVEEYIPENAEDEKRLKDKEVKKNEKA